ncbi:MAG: hypothetical protein M3Y37_06230, partial [Chloroflexota bacterium]|nr:hypothetical protein [Chloroflexota bacterium]
MRRFLVPTLAVLGLVAPTLLVTAPPASAAYTTTVSTLDTSMVGRVTGTVTTDAPYVQLALRDIASNAVVGSPATREVAGGSIGFDLETWGLVQGVVTARACADSAATSCEATVLSETFTAKDVQPQVTWPEDTTIGADQEYPVTVSDPQGGGRLVALWTTGIPNQTTELARNGVTVVPLTLDGAGAIKLFRCSSNPAETICRATGISHALTVNRYLASFVQTPPALVNPVTTPLSPVIAVQEALPAGVTLTLDWQVMDLTGTNLAGEGTAGQISGLSPADDGSADHPVISPAIHAFGVTESGKYVLRIRLSYTDPEFGSVRSTLTTALHADLDGPAISEISSSAGPIYPYRDGYQDTLVFTLKPLTPNGYDTAFAEIVDTDGFV